MIYKEFGVASSQPLRGGISLSDFINELESDPDMRERLAKARRSLATVLDEKPSLRALRLAAGLSQEKLAELAATTQSYIARIEAGALDPGTDMLARLASALATDEVTVFSAVRTQRAERKVDSRG